METAQVERVVFQRMSLNVVLSSQGIVVLVCLMHQSVQLSVRAMENAQVEKAVFQKMSLNVVLSSLDIVVLVC
jgi:hypothetical protein